MPIRPLEAGLLVVLNVLANNPICTINSAVRMADRRCTACIPHRPTGTPTKRSSFNIKIISRRNAVYRATITCPRLSFTSTWATPRIDDPANVTVILDRATDKLVSFIRNTSQTTICWIVVCNRKLLLHLRNILSIHIPSSIILLSIKTSDHIRRA